MSPLRLLALVASPALCLPACQAPPIRILLLDGPRETVPWTPAERSLSMAARPLVEGGATRFVLILVNTAEEAHVHEVDKTVFVLRGRGRIHFDGRSHPIERGTVIDIPAGARHWIENVESDGLEAYVVFTPPIPRNP